MIDPELGDYPTQEVVRCLHIALLCVQDSPTGRPKMSEVMIMLNSNTSSLQAPSKPPFCITDTCSNSNFHLRVRHKLGGVSGHTSDSGQVSQNSESITELDAR
jgi:hypothetical protein